MGALTYMADTFPNKLFIAKCSFFFVNKTLLSFGSKIRQDIFKMYRKEHTDL